MTDIYYEAIFPSELSQVITANITNRTFEVKTNDERLASDFPYRISVIAKLNDTVIAELPINLTIKVQPCEPPLTATFSTFSK